MNPFAKRIGVWCPNNAMMHEVFRSIYESIPIDSIELAQQTAMDAAICLKDGSYYRFLTSSDCARGYRFNEAYVFDYREIDTEYIEQVIAPNILNNLYIVTKYDLTNIHMFEYKDYFKLKKDVKQ